MSNESSRDSERTTKIRALNDALRGTGLGGRVYITAGIQSLGEEIVREVMEAVQTFDDFPADNDPYGEHDFGSVEVNGHRIFFKIDYYDRTMTRGSEDPSNNDVTSRVLTIMLAEEY